MGLVLLSGEWRPVREAYALLDLLNHPGHPDQKSHGRKGGTGDAEGTRVKQEDFKRPGEFDTRSVAEGAARRLAEHWQASESDVDAWIAEEARPVREYYADKSLTEKREGLAHSALMEWQGGSGGPAAVVGITAVADRLGARYELADLESQGQEYLRARPAVRRAMESFGEAMVCRARHYARPGGADNLAREGEGRRAAVHILVVRGCGRKNRRSVGFNHAS